MATRKSNRTASPAPSKGKKSAETEPVPQTERKAKVEAVRERVAAVKARKKNNNSVEEPAVADEPPATPATPDLDEASEPVAAAEPEQAVAEPLPQPADEVPSAPAQEIVSPSVSKSTAAIVVSSTDEANWQQVLKILAELPTRLDRLENSQEAFRALDQQRGADLEKLLQSQANMDRRLEQLQETTGNINSVQRPVVDPTIVAAKEQLQTQVYHLEGQLEEAHHERGRLSEALTEAKQAIHDLTLEVARADKKVLETELLLQTRTEELEELSTLNEEFDARAQELQERLQIVTAESQQTIGELERAMAASQAEETMMQLRLLELETQTSSATTTGDPELEEKFQRLQSDYQEVQLRHRELREEHLNQTLALQDEKAVLQKNLDQALLQLAATSRQYSDQVDTLEKMTSLVELCDLLLEEAESVADGIPSPPPSQVQPIRKLRQRITEMRALKADIKRPDFRASREQIALLQEELLSTRQRVLEAHTEIDRLESQLKAKK